MSENHTAITDKDGNVLQVIVLEPGTLWPSPEDAKAMAARGEKAVPIPKGVDVSTDHVYDAKTKTFDLSAEAKAARAEAAERTDTLTATVESAEK